MRITLLSRPLASSAEPSPSSCTDDTWQVWRGPHGDDGANLRWLGGMSSESYDGNTFSDVTETSEPALHMTLTSVSLTE